MDFQTKMLLGTFAVTVLLGLIIVPILRKLKVGQIERTDGPQSHLKKQGTPQRVELIKHVRINNCNMLLHI